jgi:hypothetical protein
MWRWAGVNDPESGDSAVGTLSHPAVETTHVENDGVVDGGKENNVRRFESEPHLVVVLEPACAAERSETVCKNKGNKGNTRMVTIAAHL